MQARSAKLTQHSCSIVIPKLAVNKQLADKERVAAAMENSNLLEVVNQCLSIKHN